jgi:ABC-2 type transport system ATP-binding protein
MGSTVVPQGDRQTEACGAGKERLRREAPAAQADAGAGPIISVVGLRKHYGGLAAVDGISFSVARGEIFGLLGPNGAGKTTAIECIQGLRRYDSGDVRVAGLDPGTQADELRLRIGCQLQQSALPDNIRVTEALRMFASLADRPVDWRGLMADWGLEEKASARFHSLSGGQKQRLFVALALLGDPEVVFLDEMTSGLDPAARRVAWELIDDLRSGGTTVVLVTHFMDEAERLCDRMAIMERGRVVAFDTPAGLVATHGGGRRAAFSCDGEADLAFLHSVDGVGDVVRSGRRVEVTGSGSHIAPVAAALVANGLNPDDFRVEQPSLEDVFLQLTGHGLEES